MKYPITNASLIESMDKSIDELKSKLKIAIEALEKIADPRKRDHTESDAYTRYCCVMNMAQECLDELAKK